MSDGSKSVAGWAESLKQLSAEQLVKIILEQQRVIEQLQQEIERLKFQQGYEIMNMIRKGQIQGVKKEAVQERVKFINQIFGLVT